MFNVSKNGIIEVVRGDSFKVALFINQGTDLDPIRYVLKEGEYIYFGVMEPNYSFENAIVRKKYSNEDLNKDQDVLISFNSDDTVNLQPGKYFYEVKAVILDEEGNEVVNTIIPKREFFIL